MIRVHRRIVSAAGAACAATVLAACAHGGTTAPAPVAGSVGFVHMDQLVKKHPLYDQLARYDRSIEAFDLTSTAPAVVAADPQLRAREAQLEAQLKAAADRTTTLLDEKQKQYQAQESQAIAAALRGAAPGGAGAAQIAGSVNASAAQQQSGVAAQAQRDLTSYRSTLQKQDQAQIGAAQKALSQRADRSYRAKLDELQAKESALSLKLASDDAAERLALRTKLSSLALDDSARDDVQKQLTALDRKEADALAAQRNRDQQTLAAFQTELHAQTQSDLDQRVGAIRKQSLGALAQRQSSLMHQVQSISGPVVQVTTVGGKPQQQINPNLPPELRTRIQQLHDDYQKRFQSDAKATIADFNKTRDDLQRRYADLHGLDASARQGAQAQIVELRKKRDDLYGEITAQIDREVTLIAQQRGIAVVLGDVVAPANAVDLTPDALKDIESLHE